MAVGVKTGGRKVGTPNKITADLRKVLKQVIAAELEGLSETLSQLPGKERVELVLRLMPFVLPKVESISGNYDLDWLTNESD